MGKFDRKRILGFISVLIVILLNGCAPKNSILLFPTLEPLTFSNIEEKMHEEINSYRKSKRLPQLRPDPLLSTIARSWSEEMAREEFCSHVHPDDKSMDPQQRLVLFNKSRLNRQKSIIRVELLLENVGFNARSGRVDKTKMFETVWQGLLDSKRHRKNILNKKIMNVGIGIVIGSYKNRNAMYVTQLFTVPSGNSSNFIGAEDL